MRLVFMGTPSFAVPTLKALHEAGYAIAAVYTQPPRPAGRGQKDTPSPVHEYAKEHGLPVFTPVSLKSSEAQAEFAAHKADIAVVVAYGLLLPPPILEAYPLGCINVHPSLLPRWRGAAPIQRTIMAGDTETGICIMQMDEGLDTGDVLMSERYRVEKGTTSGMLHDRLAEKAPALVLATLEAIAHKTAKPVKQGDTGVEYAKKITKEECRINWCDCATAIYNKIRGLNPHPGAFFMYGGEAIKVFEADVYDSAAISKAHAPGTVIGQPLTIRCGEEALSLVVVQRPGKKPMGIEEMLRGHPIPLHTVLE